MFDIKKNEIIFTLILFLSIECFVYREYKMQDKPNVGDLRVTHLYSKNGARELEHHTVKDASHAVVKISVLADEQVNDESVDWNIFGLEIYDAKGGWEEYYDEEGQDINEIMD
jgi:hypothetical protein